MHKYLFESGRKRDAARREVVFQAPKRRKPFRLNPPSRLSLVLIVTSRPSTAEGDTVAAPAVDFYLRPKSLLEQRYEQRVGLFVGGGDAFEALESPDEGEGAEHTGDTDDDDDDPIAAGENSAPPIPPPPTTPALIAERIAAPNAELRVGLLLRCADHFVQMTRSPDAHALDMSGVPLYCAYVKLALALLHMLLAHHRAMLHPQLELAVYCSLAETYLCYTEEHDRAEQYVAAALALAGRHGLDTSCLAADLLHCRVLQTGDASLGPHLKTRIAHYASRGLYGAADLLSLVRAQDALATDPGIALGILWKLTAAQGSEPHVRLLALLLEASLHIYRGDTGEAKPLLKSAAAAAAQSPPPVRGLHLMLTLYYYVQTGDFSKGKGSSRELSRFILRQKRAEWAAWGADGSLNVNVELGAAETATCRVSWLAPADFVTVFYLLSAVLLLTNENSHAKAAAVLEKCVDAGDTRLRELEAASAPPGLSPRALSRSIVCLNHLRCCAVFYRTWLQMYHHEDFLRILHVKALLGRPEPAQPAERACFRLLQPRLQYLCAVHRLALGDVSAAKYLFLKVYTQAAGAYSPARAAQQVALGVGCELVLVPAHNELRLYAAVHLLLLCEHEMRVFGKHPHLVHAGAAACRSLMGVLHTYLDWAAGRRTGTACADTRLRQTYAVLTAALASNPADADALALSPDDSNPACIADLHTFLRFRIHKLCNRRQQQPR
ncbi:hypothetical protein METBISCDRAFT_25086 [Metschnikowia bicuspidata]|uniref:Cohesin loading complex subunit SCC4 homolog n=1 Tax=Metschnikowia bicuspidata TaxID=27322 RepID=A0A4P9Z9G2_9ASCO|nr:hypothetical protein METBISCDRAFT_25086 [Metschnikowia bicuspidata]